MRGSEKDLASYYFCQRHAPRWHYRNAVGRRVAQHIVQKHRGKYLGAAKFSAKYPMSLVMLVAGMGDQNTVDIATAAHMNVLTDAGLLLPSQLLRYDRPVPRGDL